MGIITGNRYTIYDDEVLYGAGVQKKGEQIIVENYVEGGGNTTITAQTSLIYSYTTGNNAKLDIITWINDVSFKNINFLGTDSSTDTGYAIRPQYNEGLIVVRCKFTDFGEASVEPISCYNTKIISCDFYGSNKVGLGYGVAVVDNNYITCISGCTFGKCRHGITTGSGVTGNGYSQYFTVDACIFNNANLDTHSETGESIVFSNCHITCGDDHATNRGIGLRGGNVTIANCRIEDSPTIGIYAEEYCFDLTILTCTIKNSATYGIGFAPGTLGGRYTVQGCIVESSGEEGIYAFHDDNELSLNGNIIRNSGENGINAYRTINASICNNVIINCGIAASAGNKNGILIYETTNTTISGNSITDNQGVATMEMGIKIFKSNVSLSIQGNIIEHPTAYAISFEGANTEENTDIQVLGNTLIDSGSHLINITVYNTEVSIVGNEFNEPGTYCIITAASEVVMNDNRITSTNVGIYINAVDDCSICGNTFKGSSVGVYFNGAADGNIVSSNRFIGCTAGIQDTANSSDNLISNNRISGGTHGIYIYGDYENVISNDVEGCTVGLRTDTGANYTTFLNNVLSSNATNIVDAGTNTILPSFSVPFTGALSGAAQDTEGIDVDAATEYAMAYFKLPVHVQQVVKFKIIAVARNAHAQKMLCDFVSNGGADNEAYNTHTVTLASKLTDTGNYAANDIVTWTQTDAAITALTGGDCCSLQALYRATDATNEATDAQFRAVEVMYI